MITPRLINILKKILPRRRAKGHSALEPITIQEVASRKPMELQRINHLGPKVFKDLRIMLLKISRITPPDEDSIRYYNVYALSKKLGVTQ